MYYLYFFLKKNIFYKYVLVIGCKGVSPKLEKILDNLYNNGKLNFKGSIYPAIPKQNE